MSIPESLADVIGEWEGHYRLWFAPGDPAAESQTTALVETVGAGRFLALHYTWTFDEKPHEGFILLGVNPMASELRAEWVDSFHNSDRIMECSGPVPSAAESPTGEPLPGEVSFLGSYPAPPGPDWGWRTVLDQPAADEFRMVMYNVPPGEPEVLAVEAVYKRPL